MELVVLHFCTCFTSIFLSLCVLQKTENDNTLSIFNTRMQIYKAYLGYNNAVYTVGNPAINSPLMGIKILTFYWICLKEVIIYLDGHFENCTL